MFLHFNDIHGLVDGTQTYGAVHKELSQTLVHRRVIISMWWLPYSENADVYNGRHLYSGSTEMLKVDKQ